MKPASLRIVNSPEMGSVMFKTGILCEGVIHVNRVVPVYLLVHIGLNQ